jgi:acetylornithine deacetylase/succinyl-diaminopimelate desuccinylase-like protein
MSHRSVILPVLAALALACSPADKPADRPATAAPTASVTPGADPDWSAIDIETIQHFQALMRMDTRDPPGNEKVSADYIAKTLRDAGIDVEVFALEPHRPNVVARIRGNGSKRPLLIMGHQDVVNVDTAKWRFPPFSATRDSGWIYGRGAVDDKDNLTAGLMLMLMLKRQQTPLDRDVIFLAEVGEEGSTRFGIQFMANQHYASIDAEYCLAEGGGVTRVGGKVAYAAVSTTEKIPRAISLTARGTAGHGSVPLQSNAIVHLAAAIAKFGTWRAPVKLNETTREYFTRLATISAPERAARYLDVVSGDPKRVAAADEYLAAQEPTLASMLRTSVSPTIVDGGYRLNVIPSEATATLDVRTIPGEDSTAFLDVIRGVINDPAIEVKYAQRDVRPGTPPAPLSSEGFKAIEAAATKHYNTMTLPMMLTGATDMAYLRAKGMQCYGIGPATDSEDGPKGYGAHSDQERILESELNRFVRFQWDIVQSLARTK